jgi:hypothetical protein
MAVLVIVSGCRKDDNPKIPELTRVPTPLITKDVSANQVISFQEPEKFVGKFIVDLYFKNDIKPKKFDVLIMKNGNKNNLKVFKTDITTFPTTETITGPQLVTLFGEPIKLGDQFDIGVDITTNNDQKFEWIPAVGAGYGAGVANQVRSSLFVRYAAVCSFDASKYAGTFEVLTDEWEDYPVGGTVPVTVVDATTLSFMYAAASPKPILVKVDPANNATTVVKQEYGRYGTLTFSAESIEGDIENYVAPCDLILSVKLNHTSPAGNYGNFIIKLKKKQ